MSYFEIAENIIKPMGTQHFWTCSVENKVSDAYILKNNANHTKTRIFETSNFEIQMSDFEIAECPIKPMENNISGRAQVRKR